MSKTKYYYCEGTCQYANVYESNRDMGNDFVDHSATDGQYQITMIFDEAQRDELIKNGIPTQVLGHKQIKPVEGGKFSYRFKRPHKSKYLKDSEGNQLVVGAPDVIDIPASVSKMKSEQGTKLWEHFVLLDDSTLIGNGSKVKIKYSVYQGRATIVQLESVGVIDLVEYQEKSNAA